MELHGRHQITQICCGGSIVDMRYGFILDTGAIAFTYGLPPRRNNIRPRFLNNLLKVHLSCYQDLSKTNSVIPLSDLVVYHTITHTSVRPADKSSRDANLQPPQHHQDVDMSVDAKQTTIDAEKVDFQAEGFTSSMLQIVRPIRQHRVFYRQEHPACLWNRLLYHSSCLLHSRIVVLIQSSSHWVSKSGVRVV